MPEWKTSFLKLPRKIYFWKFQFQFCPVLRGEPAWFTVQPTQGPFVYLRGIRVLYNFLIQLFLRVIPICRNSIALWSSSALFVHFTFFVDPRRAMWQCSDHWLGFFLQCVFLSIGFYLCSGPDSTSLLFRCDEVVLSSGEGEVLAPSKNKTGRNGVKIKSQARVHSRKKILTSSFLEIT